jgi:hypothetical protein
MFRIILSCNGVPKYAGAEGAKDITEEFMQRPWHKNVKCEWDGSQLILQAENDVDSTGDALIDEFSDAISASISEPFDGDIEVVSITEI